MIAPAIVPVAEVVEGNADLQDALVDVALRPSLRQPEGLEGLVTLPVFAAIELLDAVQELWLGRLKAGLGVTQGRGERALQ